MKKWLLYVSVLVALLPLSGLIPTAYAAPDLPHTSAQPSWAASWSESPALFWDSNWYSLFTIDGSLNLNAAYVTNPPEIKDQNMWAHIPSGAYYGIWPGTYDTVNDKNGSFIGTYTITGGSCIVPGYPDSNDCGDNYSYVRPANWNNCPVTVYHQWVADDGGIGVGAGNWRHPTSLC